MNRSNDFASFVTRKTKNVKTLRFWRELSRAIPEEEAWVDVSDIKDYAGNRRPDMFIIDKERRHVTWIEVDDTHKTSARKIGDLTLLADGLECNEWSLSFVLYEARSRAPVRLCLSHEDLCAMMLFHCGDHKYTPHFSVRPSLLAKRALQ